MTRRQVTQTLIYVKKKVVPSPPRRWPWLVMFVAVLVLTPIANFYETVAGVSLAGALYCEAQCEGCRGPGRVVTWSKKSLGGRGRQSELGAVVLCQNPRVDVDALTWLEARERKDTDLKPYALSPWRALPFYFAGLLALGSVVVLALRRQWRRAEEAALRVESGMGG